MERRKSGHSKGGEDKRGREGGRGKVERRGRAKKKLSGGPCCD